MIYDNQFYDSFNGLFIKSQTSLIQEVAFRQFHAWQGAQKTGCVSLGIIMPAFNKATLKNIFSVL